MRAFHSRLVLLALLGCVGAPVQAAEDYDNCTGFVDSVPAVIATQGVWCLRGDLGTAMASGTAITIATNNVTLDCNDFKVGGLAAGPGSNAYGVATSGSRQNITLRNCKLRGFRHGIWLDGDGHLVEDNHLDHCLDIGIHVVGDNNLVRHNRVSDTGRGPGGIGIYATADLIDNTVANVHGTAEDTFVYGLYVAGGSGHEVRGNTVRGLLAAGDGAAFGIYLAGESNSSLVRNRLSDELSLATGVDSYGIALSIATSSFCAGNTVSGFVDALGTCIDAGSNLAD